MGSFMSARVRWVPDEERTHCADCGKKFSLLVRRHHCRRCGDIFCKQCANVFRKIPELEVTEMVRVCNRGCDIAYDDGVYSSVGSAVPARTASPVSSVGKSKKKSKSKAVTSSSDLDFGGL
ncbi:uncharacterized protein AMSG_01617 [Thecamonas trahens ATCC 50062]|uniref:FYVE-type domain-containing protein n=1 Tax=Thecamonas trahens ATCC 50062 TaxID=461836 RepID=A0A0L0DRW2_THETB|nr:hypothetical protein AMSG_01617 [Thecamonas trahens ATCC 50062]KNC54766.1 hypothetical protein AMSG_01617 [Thecamonas trahens ATCC 50062]|eukprot:XP_013761666.1 hypothetical protein AMSG_01617 [Thecamonas trahens ATCC 50062]